MEKFNDFWDDTPGCRYAKETLRYPSIKAANYYRQQSRQNLRLLVGVLTGHHSALNGHMYTLGVSETSFCRACEAEEETAEHLLCHCESLQQVRASIFGVSSLENIGIREASPGLVLAFAKRISWLTSKD